MSASALADLICTVPRVSIIGMAKNTGKTRTIVALVDEIDRRGTTVGLTSVGRDGERADVIDPRITKPRITVPPGGMVATSEPLLRAAGVPHEVRRRTGFWTPLGRTVIARMPSGGAVEVAGPSSNRGTAEVTEAMRELGAGIVLIDGAINRRAAASPSVADLVVLATGAALHTDAEQVVAQTVAAVDILRLPRSTVAAVQAVAAASTSMAILHSGARVPVEPRLTLGAAGPELHRLFATSGGVRHVVLNGALCEPFVEEVRIAARGREVSLVAADSSKVFLSQRTTSWYRRRKVSIEVVRPTVLAAISVNPVAPMSHRFDSVTLCADLARLLPPTVYVSDLGPPPD